MQLYLVWMYIYGLSVLRAITRTISVALLVAFDWEGEFNVLHIFFLSFSVVGYDSLVTSRPAVSFII